MTEVEIKKALHVGRSGAVMLLARVDAKRLTLVNIPGRNEKERDLRDTRHLSPFPFCQPCRDGVTTHSELTSSTSNAN